MQAPMKFALPAIAGFALATMAQAFPLSEADEVHTKNGQSWTTTGVGFGPEGMTEDTADVAPIDETVVVEEDSALDELGDDVVDEDITVMEDDTAEVAGPGSACGLEVVATSPGAVGDPCMTSEEFAATLDREAEDTAH